MYVSCQLGSAPTHERPCMRTHARAHTFGCQLKITFLDALKHSSDLICMASNEPLFVYTWNDVRVSTNYSLHAKRMTRNKPLVIYTRHERRVKNHLLFQHDMNSKWKTIYYFNPKKWVKSRWLRISPPPPTHLDQNS